jgi:cobalamin biosynthesis protein CobD/CbiB
VNLKLLNLALILTSLFGYLEWGKDNHSFLFEAEAAVFSNLLKDPASAIHPLTVIPLIGQILLLTTLFQKKPSRYLTIAGAVCIGLLMAVIFLAGVLGSRYLVILSTLPFLVVAFMAMRQSRRVAR